MNQPTAMSTPLQSRNAPEFIEKRTVMIREALNWEGGSRENPKRHDVGPEPGPLVYFMKPGKEAFRRTKPNPNDMTPLVGNGDERHRFQDMWVPLASISLHEMDSFKRVLVLVYRNTFLLDHVVEGQGLRYRPSGDVLASISELDEEVRRVWPSGLMEMLCLFDILGWNEDVKYHSENGQAIFSGRYEANVGRTNNMLTGINVTYQVALFVNHVLENTGNKGRIDLNLIFSTMQGFANGRGVAPPKDADLTNWLAPYLHA